MIIETNRLVVRKFVLDDLPAYTELHTNKNVMDLIPLPVWDEEKSLTELKSRIAYYDEKNPIRYIYAVVRKEDNQMVGGCGLIDSGNLGFEIGYRFIEKFWGNGYATEIAEGLIQYGFHKFKAKRIFAEAYIKNPGSIRVLEKFMHRIGEKYSEEYQCWGIEFELLK